MSTAEGEYDETLRRKLVMLSDFQSPVTTVLPSNLRPTIHECAHLVTRGHFRSHDKDGGHAMAENLMLHAHFTTLCFIERYCRSQFYIAGIGMFELLLLL